MHAEEPPPVTDDWAGTARRIGRGLLAAWSVGCVALCALLIAIRWCRYTSWSSAPALDGPFGELMVTDGQVFLWAWVYSRLYIRVVPIALAVLVVGFHRRLPAQVVQRVNGVWGLTPAATAVLTGAMLWLHYAFDANPTIAAFCAGSLVLVWVFEQPRVAATLPAAAGLATLGAWACYGLVLAGDAGERLTVVGWTIFLLATQRWLAPRVVRRDLALLRILAVMPANLLPALLPTIVPMHGGTRLGDGLAYSFCEVPGRGTLYASLPVCESVRTSYEECAAGRIVEYDLSTMRLAASHSFFSPAFHGRLELLVCLDDEVQATVQASVYQGHSLIQNAMAFSVENPSDFVPVVCGREIGMTIAYDEGHGAILYSSEFTNRLVRYDRRTHQFETAGADLLRPWYQPITLEPHTGSLMLHTTSIHPGRNRIYAADWMQGRYAYALDLTTLAVVARYDVGGGGALGVAVDPERDRLYVSSIWGVEVVDLATDTVVARKRMGLSNRPVVVDAARNRLYLSSMVEGKIRILDRDTLAVVGEIPVGMGTRYPHLSRDGRYLFASSSTAHYYWEADALPDARR
jgi:hypothetical protein